MREQEGIKQTMFSYANLFALVEIIMFYKSIFNDEYFSTLFKLFTEEHQKH